MAKKKSIKEVRKAMVKHLINTIPEVAPVVEAPVAPKEIYRDFDLKSNLDRHVEINNKVALVMAFKPQINVRNGRCTVLIGYDFQTGLSIEGDSVLNAVIGMWDLLQSSNLK